MGIDSKPQIVYIIGPTSGYPKDNEAAFILAAQKLRYEGYVVLNSKEVPSYLLSNYDNEKNMMKACDFVYVLRGNYEHINLDYWKYQECHLNTRHDRELWYAKYLKKKIEFEPEEYKPFGNILCPKCNVELSTNVFRYQNEDSMMATKGMLICSNCLFKEFWRVNKSIEDFKLDNSFREYISDKIKMRWPTQINGNMNP